MLALRRGMTSGRITGGETGGATDIIDDLPRSIHVQLMYENQLTVFRMHTFLQLLNNCFSYKALYLQIRIIDSIQKWNFLKM